MAHSTRKPSSPAPSPAPAASTKVRRGEPAPGVARGDSPTALALAGDRLDDLVREFLAGRKATTLRAYSAALRNFAEWSDAPDTARAIHALLPGGHGNANRVVFAYRASLLGQGVAPATVNLRLAALRAMVRLARTQGLIAWALDVPGCKPEAYRDTRGPGRAGVCALLSTVCVDDSPRGLRNRAIIRLLVDLALRRGEVLALDLEDLDMGAGALHILGKGRTGKVRISLPEPTRAALRAWLAYRGAAPGPLFGNFDPRNPNPGCPPQRLTGTSVHRIIRALGRAAGLRAPLRPHGLRHAAITEALERSRGNIRAVQKFSRHADPRTLLIYDDGREDVAGEIAKQVSAWDQ